MSEIRYLRPTTLQEALQQLTDLGQQARLLAGGTDLLIAMRRGVIHPETLVDITLLDELRGIRRQDGKVWIGALTTHSEIRHSQELASWAPLLVQSCREVGSAQIRNRGTLGGNLGNASPAADTLPALYVLNTEVQLASLQGDRWIPIDQFFTGPGKTVRGWDELIAAIRFQPFAPESKGFFLKIGQRKALRVAKVSASGMVSMEMDRVLECRLALGAVAPTVIRLSAAEEFLAGRSLTDESIERAARLAGEACSPIDDIRSSIQYRRALSGVLIKRGLLSLNGNNEVNHG